MNFLILQVFCAIFSGLMESFAIANEILTFGSPLLGLFCLVPFYIAIYRSRSYRQSFFLFALQALTVHLTSSYWLANFHGFAVFTLGASAMGTAVLAGFCGVIFHTPVQKALLKNTVILKNPVYRMLWFTGCFVLWEYIKSTGAMAYPWGTLSMTAYSWKIFTQIVDLTGVWGVTFMFALFNAAAAEGCLLHLRPQDIPAWKLGAKGTVLIFTLAGLYGVLQYNIPREAVKHMNIVLVQQNCDPWESGEEKSIKISKKLTLEAMEELKENGEETDLVLWSEGILTKRFPQSSTYYSYYPADESLSDFIKKQNTPFIIGGITRVDSNRRKSGNAAVFFDAAGEFSGYYNKMQLVPFAENLPYNNNPLMKAFMKKVVGMFSTLVPGFQFVLFEIPLKQQLNSLAPLYQNAELYETVQLNSEGRSDWTVTQKFSKKNTKNPYSFVKFSTPICFEDAFPNVCTRLYNMGSEIFLNITNDSWSKTRSAEIQHFIVASYLSIEYRTTLVRCANSGYSVVIAPNGKIIFDMPLFEEKSAGVKVPVYERNPTVFVKFGDWFAYICVAGILIYVFIQCIITWFTRNLTPQITVHFERKRVKKIQKEETEKIINIQIPAISPKEYLIKFLEDKNQ